MPVRDADIARALCPVLNAEPHTAAEQLHALPNGAYCATLPGGERVWLFSRYEHVKQLLSDPRLSLDKRNSRGGYEGFGLPPALDANLLNLDGEDHARLRRLAASAFTARRTDQLREKVEAVANTLIDAFPADGTADLVTQYCAPLPVIVISELLGIPAEHTTALRECTTTLLAPGRFGPQDLAAALGRIVALLAGVIAAKRERPADDLLSAFIEARDGADRLSEDELLSLAFLILSAGYENSVHLISASLARLLSHPELAQAVRDQDNPHTPAMDRIIDEHLRLDQPLTTAFRRFPTEDTAIGETVVPAGDTVLPAIAAANHDHAAEGTHISFGHGPHYCLGAPLARLETRVALWTALRRLPDLALAVPADQLPWKNDHRQHALTALPVIFTAQHA
jgi:cytochrome P450